MTPESEKAIETIGLIANATMQTFAMLNKCLMNTGALQPGQLSDALKATFNHPDADWERLDYAYFRNLANLLDQSTLDDQRKK